MAYNGLAPNKSQAIIWTKCGLVTGVYMRHLASTLKFDSIITCILLRRSDSASYDC